MGKHEGWRKIRTAQQSLHLEFITIFKHNPRPPLAQTVGLRLAKTNRWEKKYEK
jgi:hypothetical protein